MNSFDTFLQELAKVLHFKTLAPDSSGACLIIMKESGIPLLFEFDDHLVPNTILVSTQIAPIPVDKRAAFYEASLQGNSRMEETLSIKPDEDFLYLHRRFHPDIQAQDLDPALQAFLKQVKVWKETAEVLAKNPAQHAMPPSIKVFPYKA